MVIRVYVCRRHCTFHGFCQSEQVGQQWLTNNKEVKFVLFLTTLQYVGIGGMMPCVFLGPTRDRHMMSDFV